MAFHHGRDANITSITGSNRNNGSSSALIFHLLRAAGCSWLWECDGEVGPNAMNPNHVDDGNMEEVGTAKYVAVLGATLSKETTIVDSGAQSLKIVSAAAVGSGVRTVALLSMTNPAGRAFDALDTLVGPASEKMTINDNNNPFTTNDIGCPITITGEGNAGNNGTFIVTKFSAIGAIDYQNPSGVAVAPPTGSYEITRPYEIVLRAYNNSGVSWNIDVDRGDAAYFNVGTIPHNAGVWTEHHFSFVTLSTNPRYIRIVDASGTAHTIYIDSMMVFRSSYEYQLLNVYGSDGILTNPDQFSTAGSYTPSQKDVGRWLCVWDGTNPKNTGWYKIITDLGGGSVRVDMRSGTATFTNQGGLNWRIVDVENQFAQFTATHQKSAGYGIQSIHASGWRYFWRLAKATASDNNPDWIWAAPEDTDFDRSTGKFLKNGPSTQRNREGPYRYGDATTDLAHLTQGCQTGGALITSRTWLITDDDVSFFSVVHWNTASIYNGMWLVGYTGTDATHPGIEEFILLAKTTATPIDETTFAYSASAPWYFGTTFDSLEQAVHGSAGSYGYGAGSCVIDMSNASDNAWSGEEVLYQIPIIRDPSGLVGCPSEREINGKGIYMCRANLPTLSTFDSANYLHFKNGLCWKWNGEGII